MSFNLESTRYQSNSQDAARLRLFAAVIARAVADLTCAFTQKEKKSKTFLEIDAQTALSFIFKDGGMFRVYAEAVGMDPQQFRDALLSDRPLHDVGAFTVEDRRRLRARYLRWRANHAARGSQ